MKKSLIIALLITSSQIFGEVVNLQTKLNHESAVKEVIQTIKAKGLNHFTTIEHHKGAQNVSLKLRPTTLIIFGNPKIRTLFMQEDQKFGLELPLKILVTTDTNFIVNISYKKPSQLARNYSLNSKKKLLEKVDKAIYTIASSAVKK